MKAASRTVVFRADGSGTIGLGHLYRCAALAAMLRPDFRCVLTSRECPAAIRETLSSGFDDFTDLGELSEAQEVSTLANEAAMIVVLDGYSFTTEYQNRLLETKIRMVSIDDIHAYGFVGDLVINHAPTNDLTAKYRLSEGTGTAFGLAFSLLRQPFLRAARAQIDRTDARETPFYLNFGGADVYNVTARLIDKLGQAGYRNRLMIVLGAANPHRGEVESIAANYPGEVSIYHSLNDPEMIRLYRQACLAFLPASTTLFEALAVGLPTVTGYYVDNQYDVYHGFVSRGISFGIGDWRQLDSLATGRFCSLIDQALTNHQAGGTGIDGYSDVNLKALFNQLAGGDPLLVGRPATDHEVTTYHEWVNEASVRANSLNKDAIPFSDHEAWFTQKIRSPHTLMLYYEHRTRPCGQVRVDLIGPDTGLLDYSVDRSMRGKGFGKRLLQLGHEQLFMRYPNVATVVAPVRAANAASQRALLANGYCDAGDYEGDAEVRRYIKKI